MFDAALLRHHPERQRLWPKLARKCGYNAGKLARICGLSLRQLERYFEEDYGRSPCDWLKEQRMVAARHVLRETKSVKGTALQLGYKQESHFCKSFKSCYGITPTKMLDIHRQLLRRP